MSTEQQWDETGSSDLRMRVTLDSLSKGVILYAPDGLWRSARSPTS